MADGGSSYTRVSIDRPAYPPAPPPPLQKHTHRFNTGRQELTLTTARFLSRAHNKQYLIYLLENLVAEAKAGNKGQ